MRFISSRMWSLILAVVALLRATSYLVRPPTNPVDEEGTYLVEHVFPYSVWAMLLGGCALLLACFAWNRREWAAYVMLFSHSVLLASYLVFTITLIRASYLDGQPWTGIGPMVTISLLHAERILIIGEPLGRGRPYPFRPHTNGEEGV